MNTRQTRAHELRGVAPAERRPVPRQAAAALAAVPMAMLGFTLATLVAPVVRRGALIDWLGPYDVTRVRVLGLEVHREDVVVGTRDLLTAGGLGAVAVTGALTAAALHRREGWTRRVEVFAVAALGGAFLAVDELLSVHETVGLNLGVLRALPGVTHPDDIIVAIYLCGAVVVLVRARAVVASSRGALAVGASALVVGLAAVVVDLLPGERTALEETVELGAAGLLFLALVLLAAHHLRGSPRPGETAADRDDSLIANVTN